jgi:hypothetical protein
MAAIEDHIQRSRDHHEQGGNDGDGLNMRANQHSRFDAKYALGNTAAEDWAGSSDYNGSESGGPFRTRTGTAGLGNLSSILLS